MKKLFFSVVTLILFVSVTTFVQFVYATAWDLSSASYDNKSVSGLAKATDVFFKSDGLKMYVLAGDNPSVLKQYTLSSAWDVSTASYVNQYSFSGVNSIYWGQGFTIKSDGTTLYLTSDFSDLIYQFTFGTAWDVTTLSYSSVSLNIAGQDSEPSGLAFNTDGTKMYLSGNAGDSVYQYTLTSGWDLSTASYDSVQKQLWNAAPSFGSTQGVMFKDDGTKMFAIDSSLKKVAQFSLSSAWDLSSATYDSVQYSVSSQASYPMGVFIGYSGAKMYVSDWTNGRVYQYSLADVSLPTLSTVSPTDNATGVATTANLVMNFTEAVTVQSGNVTIYKGSDDSLVEAVDVTSGNVTGSGSSAITINPTANLAEQTAYYVIVDATAFDDVSGNSYAGIAVSSTWNFTTADETAPSVVSFSPVDDATGVSTSSNFIITFDESIVTSTGNISLYKTIDDSLVEVIDVTGNHVTASGTMAFVIDPTDNLDSEIEYYIMIAITAVDDASGNSFAGITASTTWSFTSADVIGPTISDESPSTEQPSGTSSVILSISTDESATCKYSTSSSTVFADMTVFSSTGAMAHTSSVSSSDGVSYVYYVLCQDSSGNESVQSTVSFSVEATPAPVVVPSGGGATPAPAPSVGTGIKNTIIPMGNTADTGNIPPKGINVMTYIHSSSVFQTVVSNHRSPVAQTHRFEITDLDLFDDIVTITFHSEPRQVTLRLHETQEVDLDNDGVPDVILTFAGLHINRVEVTLEPIHILGEGVSYEGTLIRYADSSRVYVVESGKKRWIQTEQAFLQKGYRWEQIVVIDDSVQFDTGEDISIVFSSPVSFSYTFTRNLEKGMYGEDVRVLQQFLNTHGYVIAMEGPGSPGNESAYFGLRTEDALRSFQRTSHLPAFGYFGPLTRRMLL